ncbi:hypothetical protein PG996_001900 [Apiospora saccharicola]|uniref:Acetyl-CoA synthetase-like protein n=1 Tax=Apiospora saccharicola TaxID=335842 RepID=A0ABR1WLV9_9PEZI
MVLESPFPPLHIPDVSIWDLLFNDYNDSMQQIAQSKSDRDLSNVAKRLLQLDEVILLSSEDGTQTYTALGAREAALRFARALQTILSFGSGDTLALVSANSVYMAPVIWGSLYLGGMVSPANPGYGVEELQHQLKNSGATVVVTQAPFLPVVLRAATNVGIAHGRVIVLPSAKSAYVSSLASSLPSARHNDNVLRLLWQKRKATPAKRLYLTHRNIVANILMAEVVSSISHEDVVLAFLPLFHILGLTILLHYSFYKCAKVAVMPRYTLPLFCKTVEAHRVSRVYLVPPVALELAQTTLSSETGTDLSSIKFMTSAGAPLSPVIVHALHARHGIKLVEGYGLSETSPGAFMMCIEDYPAAIGTVGKLLPNQKAKLLDVDDSKRDINTDSGQSGEICIKGPNVFKGGWLLRTGDIGVFVKAPRVGICLRITDRIKELIKYKGFQVAPAELEGILLRHEGVADVCVVGVQSPQALATEVPRAYVVKTPGWGEGEVERVVAADEIRRWSDKKLANHKRLRGGVVFVDSLPRTPSGKLLRRVLRSTNFDGKAKL